MIQHKNTKYIKIPNLLNDLVFRKCNFGVLQLIAGPSVPETGHNPQIWLTIGIRKLQLQQRRKRVKR